MGMWKKRMGALGAGLLLVLWLAGGCSQPAGNAPGDKDNGGFVGVTDINGVPTGGVKGAPINLSIAAVVPQEATNREIVWAIKDPGRTVLARGVTGQLFTPDTAGTVVITGTVKDGKGRGEDFTKDFTLAITDTFIPVEGIIGVPSSGKVDVPVDLNGVVVMPANASNRSIVWSVAAGSEASGAMAGAILAPVSAGNLRLTASIAQGRADGSAYTQTFSLTIAPKDGASGPAGLTGILVDTRPDILVYPRGQAFDSAGLVVKGVYSDETERVLSSGEYTLSPVDMDIPGAKMITVTSGTYTAQFPIMVNSSDLILQSISLASPPDKTGYNFGENLDLGGMVIKGHYSDMSSKTETVYSYSGYDRTKRGTQTITLSINRKTAEFDVTVKVHAGVTVSVNGYRTGHGDARLEYKHAYAKGTPMSLESLQITVKANGATRIMTLAAGDFTLQELNPTGYDSNKPGNQSPEITLDEKPISLAVYVIDADPQVFFDYGYWRHDGNPNGGPPIAGATPQYTVPLGQTLVITPVAFLMTTLAPSYDWSVSGADYTTSGPGNKFLHITPKAGGLVTANVTVSAGGVSASARANIYCTSPRPGSPPATMDNPSFSGPMPPVQTLGNTSTAPSIRNFAPGQFTKGGTGYGWSLGAAGGYEVWKLRRVNDGTKNFTIRGNPLGGWCEPGIVWVSVDDNQNGLPDDTWYELKGCEEESPIYKPLITRSYGIIYVRDGEAGEVTNEFGQILGGNYWVDTKGRTGRLPGGWPSVWGVNGDRVTFAGTLLRDDGKISTGGYDDLNFNWGYVDTYGTTFNIADAIKADGTAANLPWIDFVKVQTGMFVYGGIFGDVSTEINFADGLGTLTDFPDP